MRHKKGKNFAVQNENVQVKNIKNESGWWRLRGDETEYWNGVRMRYSDGCRQGVVKLFTQESTKDISYIISTRCGINTTSYSGTLLVKGGQDYVKK